MGVVAPRVGTRDEATPRVGEPDVPLGLPKRDETFCQNGYALLKRVDAPRVGAREEAPPRVGEPETKVEQALLTPVPA